MLTIIISILIGTSMVLWGWNKSNFFISVGAIIMIAGACIGLFCPISGYDFKEKETIAISSFRSKDMMNSKSIYIEISGKEAIYSQNGKDTKKVSGNVVTIEQAKCSKPILKIEEGNGKISMWTFALLNHESRYIFYVPKGTIMEK